MINISFVMCAFFVTFRIMDVIVCKKDKEISDVKNVPYFFPTNIRKLAISFEIGFIFPLNFHLFDEKT